MNVESKAELPEWLLVLRRQVETLRFGAVQVTVHDARVVQIETTEKHRFDPATNPLRGN